MVPFPTPRMALLFVTWVTVLVQGRRLPRRHLVATAGLGSSRGWIRLETLALGETLETLAAR